MRALGLHIAGSETNSVFSPLYSILDTWNLEIVTQIKRSDRENFHTSNTRPPVGEQNEAIDILARTIWGEAEGELVVGKRAVAAVVVNRTKSPRRFASTVERVCLARKQFSCWNPGPRKQKLQLVDTSNAQFRKSIEIAKQALAGKLSDPVHGADHYHHRNILPYWAKGHSPIVGIGNHVFYKLNT